MCPCTICQKEGEVRDIGGRIVILRQVHIQGHGQRVNDKNMKRQNGVRAAYVAFLLRALQAGFGCAAVLNTLQEAYHCLQLFFAAVVWLV